MGNSAFLHSHNAWGPNKITLIYHVSTNGIAGVEMEGLLVFVLFSWWILFIIDTRAVLWTTFLLKTEKVDIEVSAQLFSICECPLWAIAPFKKNYPLYKPLHYLKQSTSIIIKQKKKFTNFQIMTAALYTMTWNITWFCLVWFF